MMDGQERQKRRPRVLVADDHQELLVALTRLLKPACEVVGTASNGREAVDRALALRPDIVILDLAMPELNGFEACRLIAAHLPDTRIVLLTATEDYDLEASARDAGASAVLRKHEAGQELGPALQRIFSERGDRTGTSRNS
jgi:NarL family two-component system response regulator LiaR